MFKIKERISSFFLLWLAVVSISIFLAFLLVEPLGNFLYENNSIPFSAYDDSFVETYLSLVFLVGLFMGIGQWTVINTKIKKAHSWILATLIGFFVGSFISFIIFGITQGILSNLGIYDYYGWIPMIGTLFGTGMITGVCQWVSLKRKIIGSLKWSLVTGMSFVIGILSIILISDYLVGSQNFTEITYIISAGLIALISGYFAEATIISPKIENITQHEATI